MAADSPGHLLARPTCLPPAYNSTDVTFVSFLVSSKSLYCIYFSGVGAAEGFLRL